MENDAKTASCLAITEKKTQSRPGGCVGIFFRLFDWNRKFAKRKLFSKKLLPPGKQACMKFIADEKMPISKLHLLSLSNKQIAGESSGKKNGNQAIDSKQKQDMWPPGLVARLMGLESMPARTKPKKPSISDTHFNREDANFSNRSIEVESRPQKLQKTRQQSNKQAVARFGAEAMQFKYVLTRSRKNLDHNHHPKLALPVKSPRFASGRVGPKGPKLSRLMNAATRILEPELRATNRARHTLSYPQVVEEITEVVPTSCKNCGNLIDVRDFKPNLEKQLYGEELVKEKLPQESQLQLNLSVNTGKSWKDGSSSFVALERKKQSYDEMMSSGRDRILPKSRLSNGLDRRIGPSNDIVSGTRARIPMKVESAKFGMERRGALNQKLRNPEKKRRDFENSNAEKDLSIQCDEDSLMKYMCTKNGIHRKDKAVIPLLSSLSTSSNTAWNQAEMEEKNMDNGRLSFQEKPFSLGGESIGALLEQKLKRLTTHEDNKKSAATILQELIYALIAESPISHDGSSLYNNPAFCDEVKMEKKGIEMSKDQNHFSPGSVLESAFSTSSIEDGGSETVTDLLNNISRLLQSMNLTGIRLTGHNLSQVREVLLNGQLLFGKGLVHLVPFFLDRLEITACKTLMDFGKGKGGNLRRFVFNSLIECLEYKNNTCFFEFGCSGWRRGLALLGMCFNGEMMIKEVEEEIRKWTGFARMVPEEMIEWEMEYSLGKWSGFNGEAFEVISEGIDWDILQSLVEEMVVDLWECYGEV